MRPARLCIVLLAATEILGQATALAAPIELPPGPMFFRLPDIAYRDQGFLSFHAATEIFCSQNAGWPDLLALCSLRQPLSVEGMAGCSNGPDPANLVVIWRLETATLPEVGSVATVPVRLYTVRFPWAVFGTPCTSTWAVQTVVEESEGMMTLRRHTDLGGDFDLAFDLHANLEFGWWFVNEFEPVFSYRVGPYAVTATEVPWNLGNLEGEAMAGGSCPDCVGDFAVGSGLLRGEGTMPEAKHRYVYLDRDEFILPIAAACVVGNETGVAGMSWSAVKELYR